MNGKLTIMDPDAVESIYREGWSDGARFYGYGGFATTADEVTAAATEAWEASRARRMYASNRPRTERPPGAEIREDERRRLVALYGADQPSAGPWEAHDDDGTGTLPCVLSEHVNPSGTFYVAQCNRYADAVLCSAAPDLANALEGSVHALEDARRLLIEVYGPASPTLCGLSVEAATAALRKAGRLS